MTLTRKDAVATGLTGPAILTYPVLFGVLGGAAFVFGVLALITGSLTPLSLLVADMVVMWALTSFRHAHTPPGRPVAT